MPWVENYAVRSGIVTGKSGIVTDRSGNMTAESGKHLKSVTFGRIRRSRSTGLTGHVRRIQRSRCAGIPTVLGVALFALFRDGRNTRAIAALATGLAAPIILWEAYRLVSLGSLAEFAHWWRLQLGQVLAQSGARGQNGVNLFAKALAHLEILRSITGLGALTLAPLLLSPPALALLVRPSLGQRARFLVDCLLAAGVFYFAWWLLVSPTHMAWARRIINGLVILQMLVAFLAVLAARRMLVNLRTVRVSRSVALSAILSLGGLLAAGMLAMNGQHATRPLRSGDDHTGFYALIDRVRTLPSDATVFGTGWWQAPTVALYSGRPIHNIERWTSERINALQSKYLLFDFYAVGLARAQTEQALALVRGEKIFESSGGVLYRIDEARPYAPIEVSAAEVQRLKPRMDFSEGDYEFKSGFYDIESRRHAWMRPDAEVILSRRAERFLRIVLFAPDRLLGTGSVTVSIRTPGCGERTFPLTRAGEHDLRMSLQCDPSADAVPLAVGIHTDAHMPFVRQIDSDNRMRSLVVRSIALLN